MLKLIATVHILIQSLLANVVFGCHYSEYSDWALQRVANLHHNQSSHCDTLSGGKNNQNDKHLSSVKLFLFQKDELELLSDFLQYHSSLFGISNIHIVDNESNDVRTCKLLALYHTCGATITTHSAPFSEKQFTLTRVMREASKSSFLVPLDADEFIVLPEHLPQSGLLAYSFYSRSIRSVFDHLSTDGRKYKFQYVYPVRYEQEVCHKALSLNFTRRALNPGIVSHPQYHAHNTKTFYHAKGFISTDQGNHYGKVEHDNWHYNSDPVVTAHLDKYFAMSGLSLLHFPVSTLHALKRKVLRAADAYGYNGTSDCTAIQSGQHYCALAKVLRTSEAQSRAFFLRECQNRHNVGIPTMAFSQWFVDNAMSLEELIGE